MNAKLDKLWIMIIEICLSFLDLIGANTNVLFIKLE